MSAPIQIVDENDQPARAGTKQEVWEQGLIHRIVRILVENDKGEVLLQLRSPKKPTYPNCWDNAVGGHVDAGEDYEDAAYRELEEELGISGEKLIEVDSYRSDETIDGKRLNRFNKVYKLVVSESDLDLRMSSEEVAAIKWVTKDEVKQLVAEHPDQVTDGLRQIVQLYD